MDAVPVAVNQMSSWEPSHRFMERNKPHLVSRIEHGIRLIWTILKASFIQRKHPRGGSFAGAARAHQKNGGRSQDGPMFPLRR